MWRFFALATAIVGAAVALILALPDRRAVPDTDPAYSSSHATPGPAQRDDFRRRPQPVTGTAPWALSALPECFRQQSSRRGPAAFARAAIPRGARRVTGSATLHIADCTLVVEDESALVTRGENRLRIPARAYFYVAGRRLILDLRDGSREDVRVYGLAGNATPSFAAPKAAKL